MQFFLWYACRELPEELVTVVNQLQTVLATDRRVTEAYLRILVAFGHPAPFKSKSAFLVWVSLFRFGLNICLLTIRLLRRFKYGERGANQIVPFLVEFWEISTNRKELRLPNSECIGLDIYRKAQVLATIEFGRVLYLSASTCAMIGQIGVRISFAQPAKLFELKSCRPICPMEPCSSARIYGLRASRSVTYCTDLELG